MEANEKITTLTALLGVTETLIIYLICALPPVAPKRAFLLLWQQEKI